MILFLSVSRDASEQNKTDLEKSYKYTTIERQQQQLALRPSFEKTWRSSSASGGGDAVVNIPFVLGDRLSESLQGVTIRERTKRFAGRGGNATAEHLRGRAIERLDDQKPVHNQFKRKSMCGGGDSGGENARCRCYELTWCTHVRSHV
ncbi:hypothetical protein ALC62_06880 [Cyphomyrmex costatus]|uniref:Uncharacterized protein n=1 Tax=Cyphomyrmex costatus TaxID=456900 RepID=A0A151IIG0_9HYME|nr:hypothetical protein ALC62_06880 [Cyphomyrmex costatus]